MVKNSIKKQKINKILDRRLRTIKTSSKPSLGFLKVTFNVITESYQPFREPNNDLKYCAIKSSISNVEATSKVDYPKNSPPKQIVNKSFNIPLQ